MKLGLIDSIPGVKEPDREWNELPSIALSDSFHIDHQPVCHFNISSYLLPHLNLIRPRSSLFCLRKRFRGWYLPA